MVFFDELQDLNMCHLLASLDPDRQSAWWQVGGFLVLICTREISIIAMLYVELEEGSNLFAITMWCTQPLTQDLLVSWWDHFEELEAARGECAEGEEEVDSLEAGEG